MGTYVKIRLFQGDITAQDVDAIVNAANSSLMGGGGVDGAIHQAAGPSLRDECERLRETILRDGLPVGHAVATGAGWLPASWVIHTVGPNKHVGQSDPRMLASAFTESLDAAVAVGAETIAFPAISAGVYGWDAREVAEVAAEAIGERTWPGVREVRFVLFNEEAAAAFSDVFALEIEKG